MEKVRHERKMKIDKMEEELNNERKIMKEKIENEEKKKKEIENDKIDMRFSMEKKEVMWKSEKENLNKRMDEYKDSIDNLQHQNKKLTEEVLKLKADKKKGASFIRAGNQTAFIPREVPVENKENTQLQ